VPPSHDNPSESPIAHAQTGDQVNSTRPVFPLAIGLVIVTTLGLCVLSPTIGIFFACFISAPGLLNGYVSLKRQLEYDSADSSEQWFCVFLGFVQLIPLGLLALVFGGLMAFAVDASSTEDSSIDEALGGMVSAVFVYVGGIIAMIRWKSRN